MKPSQLEIVVGCDVQLGTNGLSLIRISPALLFMLQRRRAAEKDEECGVGGPAVQPTFLAFPRDPAAPALPTLTH